MYACIRETGGGFFAGVCRQENRYSIFVTHLTLRDRLNCEKHVFQTDCEQRRPTTLFLSKPPFPRRNSYLLEIDCDSYDMLLVVEGHRTL
jgi:hypothetical protein